jgi:hypothetical protein
MEENTTNEQTQPSEGKQRPTAITVICVLGFIGALIVIPLIFSPLAERVGSWYPPYLGFSAVVGFICMIGLWQMKKWAAYLYTGFTLVNQIILLTMGSWNILALILPGIVIGIALSHVNKMA